MRDHLDRLAEVLAAPLSRDHGRVHLARGHVRARVEVDIEETLVVPDVEIGLSAVVGDEHLAVLERIHRPRIDVDVRVELLHRHPQAPALEQVAEAGGRQTLAETRRDTAGHEDVFGDVGLNHARRRRRSAACSRTFTVTAEGRPRWAAGRGVVRDGRKLAYPSPRGRFDRKPRSPARPPRPGLHRKLRSPA